MSPVRLPGGGQIYKTEMIPSSRTNLLNKMDHLTEFLTNHSHIHYAIPSSPDFESLRGAFVINTTIPAMIVRPQSAEDVAATIRVLKENHLPFTIRVGGHDMFGRSQVQDAVTIDLRELAFIHIDRENGTARLGGGVLFADLLVQLDRHGLAVPNPLVSGVGVVGWATHAGYGLLTPQCGLGVDQILQAKVVDAQGLVRDADKNMLTAIRGGGGAVGVIVELTIKVYPLGQVRIDALIYEVLDANPLIRYLQVSSCTTPATYPPPSSATMIPIVSKQQKAFLPN